MPNFKFDHGNLNVLDLDRSLNFYRNALGLTEFARLETQNYIFVYLGAPYRSDYVLELQWSKTRKKPYELGEKKYHLAFITDDIKASYELHKKMNCISQKNSVAGIYWIEDPDGFLIEILPQDSYVGR